MKVNINNLSKLNPNDVNLNTLKININILLKKLFIINLINIKPITNPLNNHNNLILRKDKIKHTKNKSQKHYILSASNKHNYFIRIPNIL
ncbi:Aspartyl/glutamyl-tRNA(Asn/Gln) amidotransferase subunit C [Candidatus Portiera aleyrodidarum]|uniref:Uncharacterized protein n=1 Tax=Candidatus Portiera aleyrodidarum TV TaxID=1297582 RepID=A0A8D3X8X7_9GAMM|nr:hypothetical protein [Candidatus Portiera aleyrodidarum]AGI27203.1 hypothetical protein PalTV_226 [Candidatus Portiera aleyrodidarum TV]CEI59188.1 Aspartyl/glutamyl-tRNA(Asn/Gln) amidotransferase subunit C [Candidatus Portiera aleyrodidarum]